MVTRCLGRWGFDPCRHRRKVGRPIERGAFDGDGCFQRTSQDLYRHVASRSRWRAQQQHSAWFSMEEMFSRSLPRVTSTYSRLRQVGRGEGCVAIASSHRRVERRSRGHAINARTVVVEFRTDSDEKSPWCRRHSNDYLLVHPTSKRSAIGYLVTHQPHGSSLNHRHPPVLLHPAGGWRAAPTCSPVAVPHLSSRGALPRRRMSRSRRGRCRSARCEQIFKQLFKLIDVVKTSSSTRCVGRRELLLATVRRPLNSVTIVIDTIGADPGGRLLRRALSWRAPDNLDILALPAVTDRRAQPLACGAARLDRTRTAAVTLPTTPGTMKEVWAEMSRQRVYERPPIRR